MSCILIYKARAPPRTNADLFNPERIDADSPGSTSNRDDHPGLGDLLGLHPERRARDTGCAATSVQPQRTEGCIRLQDFNQIA